MDRDRELTRVLVEFAHTLGTDFSIAETLDHLVLHIVEALPVSGAGVMLMGSEHELHFVAASNEVVQGIETLQNKLHEGPCLTSFLTGAPVAIPDVNLDSRFPQFSAEARQRGLAAVFTFPLRFDGRSLGALDLYRDTPGELDAGDMTAAEVLADVAAAYLFNARIRSDARSSEQLLRHRSLHDPLTGLPNRTLLEERLDDAVELAGRSDKVVAVLFVDLDDFKEVNDDYGHHLGDQLLRFVAARLSSVLRPGDTLARLGGDEFVILCDDLTDPSQGELIAERVAGILSKPFPLAGHMLTVTASVGVAFSGPGEEIPRDLIRDADLAMYQAKRRGGAQHRVLHDPIQGAGDATSDSMPEVDRRDLGKDLRGALTNGELQLAYQPIVDTRDGSLRAVEALLRWRHPTRGWVPPETIMPIAERTGLIVPVGRWVLMRACQALQDWRTLHGAETVPLMSVNVSGRQVVADNFVRTVMDVLTDTGTDPSNLALEVTESVLLTDEPRAHAVLHQLGELGVMLSMDDFGTGYSSLAYLKNFPFHTVKIDRAFIADLDGEAATRAIVAAVIDLAHALNLAVVAEGVETESQLARVRELGGESAQGYYFSRPLLHAEFEQILRDAGRKPVRLPLSASA